MIGIVLQGSRAKIRVPPLQMRILDALRCGGRIPTPEFVKIVWPEKRPTNPSRALRRHICELRAIVAYAGLPYSIESIRHKGYRLDV